MFGFTVSSMESRRDFITIKFLHASLWIIYSNPNCNYQILRWNWYYQKIKHKDERENIIVDKEQDRECYLKVVLKMKPHVTIAKSKKGFWRKWETETLEERTKKAHAAKSEWFGVRVLYCTVWW